MRLFQCQCCGQVLHFENTKCLRCGRHVGYLPERGQMLAVEPEGSAWRIAGDAAPGEAKPNDDREGHAESGDNADAQADICGPGLRFCANWELSACNWMVPAGEGEAFCLACSHNRTVPDLSDGVNHARWQKIEAAKRRLVYSLLRLGLPLPQPGGEHPEPLVFDFLADAPGATERVLTGHSDGVITISLTEADDATREKMRTDMGEAYRTLLGHFRHEVGHYYWDILVRDGGHLEAFRALFGDDTEDYSAALGRHYANGAPAGWQEAHVSAYATMHAWEDWAETWAHYLHMVDTLETAAAFGLRVEPELDEDGELSAELDFDPHRVRRIRRLLAAWMPLTVALNALNRSMGQADLYPFVLAPAVLKKLGFVHDLIAQSRDAQA